MRRYISWDVWYGRDGGCVDYLRLTAKVPQSIQRGAAISASISCSSTSARRHCSSLPSRHFSAALSRWRDRLPTRSSRLRNSRPRLRSDSSWLVVDQSATLPTALTGAVTPVFPALNNGKDA